VFGEHREPGEAQLRGLGYGEHQGVERLDEICRVERSMVSNSQPGGHDWVLRGSIGHRKHDFLDELHLI